MHLPDGVLPVEVVVAGAAAGGAATWVALRRIQRQEDPRAGVPQAALFTAVFFVASWIHIPLPPVSVHLVLPGLMGVVLGWYAMPAIVIGLFFQAVMFGHGGITTLGVNAVMMGVPALLAHLVFRMRGRAAGRVRTGTFAFLGGALGLALAASILLLLLVSTVPTGPGVLDPGTARAAVYALVLAHVPLAVVEGAFTAMVVLFLHRVRPEILAVPARA